MRKSIFQFAFIAMAAGPAFAAPAPALQGVWKGTIGNLPVQACFQTESDFQFGAYFYLSQLKIIHLDKPDKGDGWWETEVNKGPHWLLKTVEGDAVLGSWEDKGKTLPIALKRVSLGNDEANRPCGSDAFMAPRLTPPKVTEAAAKLGGVAFTKIDVDVGKQFDVAISGFKLNGAGGNVTKINKLLTSIIPTTAAGSDYADCMKSALYSGGRDGTYNVSLSPVVLTRNWLVARNGSDDFCGGAHPNAGSVDSVYDLAAGVKVDVEKWFMPDAMDVKDGINPKGTLREFVVKSEIKHGSSECSDVYENANYWNVALSKAGVNFTPSLPHAEAACAESVDVPFAMASKFMNAAARAKLKSFQAEASK